MCSHIFHSYYIATSVFTLQNSMRRLSHSKPLKNKAGCWPFLHIFKVKINPFFLLFWCHFGVHFGILGGVLGGLGSWRLPSSDFDRFWIDFGTPLGAKLAPTSRPWSVVGRLDTSWGGPCVVWNPVFSNLMSNSFSHGILHRFRTAKRPQNH